jgi:hypothetical protein
LLHSYGNEINVKLNLHAKYQECEVCTLRNTAFAGGIL